MSVRIWHVVVFVLALAVFALAFAPASLAVRPTPGHFTYQAARGTIWNGALVQPRLGGYALETLAWRLSLLDLAQGRIVAPLTLRGAIDGEGRLLANFGGDRRIAIGTLKVQGAAFGGAVLTGETRIDDLDLYFEDGACAAARGTVESDLLLRAGDVLGFVGSRLSGGAACEGEAGIVQANGYGPNGEHVVIALVLNGNGAGAWRFTVRGARSEAQTALAAAGFADDAANGQMVREEEIRWFPF